MQSRRRRELANGGSKKGNRKEEASAAEPAAIAKSAAPAAKRKLSYKEQRELDQLPAQIDALETEQKSIREQLADGTIYSTDGARAAVLTARDGEIDEALMHALERWSALST